MTAEFHWDDARIFLAIARAGTLSGAADKMNMGIATVSRRLDRWTPIWIGWSRR